MILLEFDNVLTTGAHVDVHGSTLTCCTVVNLEKFDLKNESWKKTANSQNFDGVTSFVILQAYARKDKFKFFSEADWEKFWTAGLEIEVEEH